MSISIRIRFVVICQTVLNFFIFRFRKCDLCQKFKFSRLKPVLYDDYPTECYCSICIEKLEFADDN